MGRSALSLVVRARGDAASLAPAVRDAIWSVDNVPIVRVATMERARRGNGGGAAFRVRLVRRRSRSSRCCSRRPASTACCRAASPSACARSACAPRSARRAASMLGLVLRQGMALTRRSASRSALRARWRRCARRRRCYTVCRGSIRSRMRRDRVAGRRLRYRVLGAGVARSGCRSREVAARRVTRISRG